MNEKLPPAPIVPEFHMGASDVEVWAIASLFVHVTVVPAATVTGFGLYARVPNPAALTGMETLEDGPGAGEGAGVGEGVDGLLLLQPTLKIETHKRTRKEATEKTTTRTENMTSPPP